MVHVVVHIQQFINKRNVKYKPYGPWGHFLGQCTLKLITLSLRRLRPRRARSIPDGVNRSTFVLINIGVSGGIHHSDKTAFSVAFFAAFSAFFRIFPHFLPIPVTAFPPPPGSEV